MGDRSSLWPETAIGRLYASQGWSPVDGNALEWPEAVHGAVSLMLGSGFPMFIVYGPQRTLFYNQAYAAILGPKHPAALGRPFFAVWSEVRADIEPVIDAAFQGQASYFEDFEVKLERDGPAAAWFTFSYSPIFDAQGSVPGVLCVCTETTRSVLANSAAHEAQARQERNASRLRFLDSLSLAAMPLTSADEILATTTRMVGEYLDLSCCAYADMDADQDGFTIRGDWSAPGSPSIVGHYRLADFGQLAVRNLGRGEPLVVNDIPKELAPHEAKTFRDIGIAATICMPLVKDGRLTALMAIHNKVARAWTEDDLSLIREVTDRSWAHVARVGAEAELRASHERFRAAVAAVEGVLWTNDADGRMTGDQPGWSAITGQTRAEYEGYGWSQAVHPEDAEPTVEAWQAAVTQRKPFVFEHRLRRRDGRWGHFSVRATPVPGDDGEIREWVGVHTDITEQRQAEQRLRESEEQLRLATEAAEIGLWDVDPVTDTLYWPPRVKAMFGVSPDAEVTMADDFIPCIHPEDRARVEAAYAEATDPTRRAVYDVEYRVIGKEDGVLRWVAAKGRALFDARGECRRVIGAAMDITARKRDERAAAEQAQSLQVLNTTGAALAAELDLDNIVQLVTDAGVRIAGAQFGAFFYNLLDERGESYMLYALSGADRSEFDKFPMPRNTAIFGPTFTGEGVVRSDDITKDARYGRNAPRQGMPDGHLPVRSYLAVPVLSRAGGVLGGLFFGHQDAGVFNEGAENLVKGIAGQAAIAIDNARLYQAAQTEIDQRRRVEAQQVLLINELNHRVKNTLATVQSIVAQTSRRGASAPDMRHAIEGRLLALSAAHDLLTRHNWEGADLRDVVDRASAAFRTDDGRIAWTGPSVQLAPPAALAISMAIHELATNAVKYGALGPEGGHVDITWSAQAGGFELEWRERGGPAVAPPVSRGFGSRLLERGLAADLQGAVTLEFPPDGVVCRIRGTTDKNRSRPLSFEA